MNHMFPTDLLELGRSSLEEMSHSLTEPSLDTLDLSDETNEIIDVRFRNHEANLIRLNPSEKEVPVVAIDTTNVELGQTEKGILSVVRGTIVKVERGNYEYVRSGPFIFHVTNKNRQALYDNLSESVLGIHNSGTAPPLEKMTERIRSAFERRLQRQASLMNAGALILWDGSLAAPTASRSLPLMRMMLKEASERENAVLAFSKKTTLALWGENNDVLNNHLAPSLLDIDEDAHRNNTRRISFLGHVFAAKLRPGSFTIRLDVDRALPGPEAVEAVQKLLVSDGLYENYPETLRLAHVLSKFSPAETIGIHRFIGETYGFHARDCPSIRRIILGPLERDFPCGGVFNH